VQDQSARKARRKPKQAQSLDAKAQAVKAMPVPPAPLQPHMTFAEPVCVGLQNEHELRPLLESSIADRLDSGWLRMRVGRLGRVLLDQADEDTLLPFVEPPEDEDAMKEEDGVAQLDPGMQRLQRLLVM
jgi:hypothetical protein